MDKLHQVLAYEVQGGYRNFTGRSGERFSEWMVRTLRSLGVNSASSSTQQQQQCDVMVQQIETYVRSPSLKERSCIMVELMTAADALDGYLLQKEQHPENTTPEDTTNGGGGGSVDVDALAAEAHAEETSTTTSSTTTATTILEINQEDALTAAAPTLVEEGYVMVGNKKLKASTAAFRQSFAQHAAMQHAAATARAQLNDDDNFSSGEQRTSQWHALRNRRLTASAFSKALGFFQGDRMSLWEEKVGLAAPFAGNEATSWGTRMEPQALSTYESLTGQQVESCMFRVKHDDPPHGWLGASPDGLVQGLGILNTTTTASTTSSSSSSVLGLGPGILEIKCPYNKGRPEEAVPPHRAIWYYMPQLQGLMDIFDRQWCTLYIWTHSHGSVAFSVARDREYWAAAFEVLADFWWVHVVPARQAHDAGAPRIHFLCDILYNTYFFVLVSLKASNNYLPGNAKGQASFNTVWEGFVLIPIGD